jgi:hypothetical protein
VNIQIIGVKGAGRDKGTESLFNNNRKLSEGKRYKYTNTGRSKVSSRIQSKQDYYNHTVKNQKIKRILKAATEKKHSTY